MKRFFFCVLAVAVSFAGFAAWGQDNVRWMDPFDEGAGVFGQGWQELNKTYVRLPDRAQDSVRGPVWGLSRNSAGLSLRFKSDSPEIYVKYKVSGGYSMYHMPATGVSGVDLYAKGEDGKAMWCSPVFPASFASDEINYRYTGIVFPDGSDSFEYVLYLPLYNSVTSLEIGVLDGKNIEFHSPDYKKPIVVYGTSIAQGACASRPGMAWTNMVDRLVDEDVVNLGFSGNAFMEKPVFELMAEIDAGLYIIDCSPNMKPADDLTALLLDGVRILREHNSCPILVVEDFRAMVEFAQPGRTPSSLVNDHQKDAFKAVVDAGYENMYYLACEQIDFSMDSVVESHPNDYGMKQNADAIMSALEFIGIR